MAAITRIRLALDGTTNAAIDVLTSDTPFIWRGADVQFELGIFGSDQTLASIVNLDSISIQVRSADRRGSLLMAATLARSHFNLTLTQPAWDAGTDAHAVLAFTNGQTAIDLDGAVEGTYWLVVSAITTDSPAKVIILGTSVLTVGENGSYTGDNAPQPAQLYLTAAQSDARYQMAWVISDLVTEIDAATSTANAAAAAAVAAAAASIPLTQKGANNGVATLGSDGIVPFAELPPVATPSTNGLMSASQAALLAGLSQSSAASSIGFDGAVRCLMVADGMLYCGGDFTKYGGTASQYIARLNFSGSIDAGWTSGPKGGYTGSGTGCDSPVYFIRQAADGDILIANGSASMNWYLNRLGSGRASWILKITKDGLWDQVNLYVSFGVTKSLDFIYTRGLGDPILDFCVDDTGLITVIGRTNLDVVDPTQYTVLGTVLQVWNYGKVIATKSATKLNALAVLGGNQVFLSGDHDTTFDGSANPEGIKLIDSQTDIITGQGAGHVVLDYNAIAGTGAEVNCFRMVTGHSYGSDYVIAANLPNSTNKWNGGSSGIFGGLYKIKSDGSAATDFDVSLTLDGTDAAPYAIPFAIDSLGRIYIGGPITAINGTTVTPWMIYRITAAGALDQVFDQFAGGHVLAMVLRGDSVLCAGGSFTSYQGKPAGRIAFIDATTGGPADAASGLVLADDEGLVKTSLTQPDPTAFQKYIWIKPGSPPVMSVVDTVAMAWVSICSICALPQQLPGVTYSPVSGTAIGGGINVTLACPGHAGAVIHYTLDGSHPTAASTIYSGPIALGAATTIKAIAVQSGWIDSTETISQYDSSSLTQLDPPTIAPTSGTAVPVTCTLTHGVSGVSIYYTLDGTPPSTSSTLYTGGISIASATTIMAIAVKTGYATSNASSATFTAVNACPSVTGWFTALFGTGMRIVVYSQYVAGMVVRYTWDGTDPTPSTAQLVAYSADGGGMSAELVASAAQAGYQTGSASGFFVGGYTGPYFKIVLRCMDTAPGRSPSTIYRRTGYFRADNGIELTPA